MKYMFMLLVVLVWSPCSSSNSADAVEPDLLGVFLSGVRHTGSAAVLIDGFKPHDVDVVDEGSDRILSFLAEEFESNQFHSGTRATGNTIWLTNADGVGTHFGAFEVFFDDTKVKNAVEELVASVQREHFRTLKTGYLFKVYIGQSSILIVFHVATMDGLWPAESHEKADEKSDE